MLVRRSFLLAFAAVTVVACGSLPDLMFADDAGTASEGGVSESGASESGASESGVDSGRDTAPPCIKSGPEICDDGLDNDCNGLKDCEDPACGSFACVTPAPDTWQLVAFVETAPPACPTDFTAPTDLKVLSGSAVHTCPCSCVGSGGTGPTCAGAMSTVTTGDDPACLANQTTTSLNSNTAGVCTATATNLVLGGGASTGFAKLTSPTGPLTCAPSASITKTDPTDGRVCTPPSKSGAGCSGALRCLPKAPGFTMCIAKDGDQVCPTGFAQRRTVGTTSADTRSCIACTCASAVPTPCSGTVTLWMNNACNAKKANLTTAGNAACAAPQAVSDTNVTAKYYQSTITGGCALGTPSSAAGEFTFGGQRTVCCK